MATVSESLETTIRELVDRQEIMACLHRYTRGVDRVDADLIRSVFHPDATDYHGPVTGSVEDFLAYWLPLQDSREVSQHYISNTEIDLDGDSAHVETYFVYYQKLKGDPAMEIRGGRYADKFERRDGDWKIAVRVVMSEWAMNADGRLTTERVAQLKQHGRRDRTDPVFIRPLVGPPDEL
jgi:SnoaL-like domain